MQYFDNLIGTCKLLVNSSLDKKHKNEEFKRIVFNEQSNKYIKLINTDECNFKKKCLVNAFKNKNLFIVKLLLNLKKG